MMHCARSATRLFPRARLAFVASALVFAALHGAGAKTESGNDFCLYLSEALEAKNAKEIAYLKEQAEGVNYFFRYLEILDLRGGREQDRPYVDILAREPSSYVTLRFRVRKSNSLTVLMTEPRSSIGHALAVTGRIRGIDTAARRLDLDPVIVRHKDRLTPKIGKELLGEVDPTAMYYSYTAMAGKGVAVSYADKDLIENNRHRMPDATASDEQKKAWADFLRREIANRERVRLQTWRDAGLLRDAPHAPAVNEEP